MSEQNRSDVAVFIDFENIYVSVRDKLDANPNFEIIMDRCNELGRVILARAFADWYRYPRITSALYANNIEPIYVPTYYYDKDAGRTGRPIKNSVDMNLCIDAMRTLFTMPQLSTFVLITGDRDFIPLVNSMRQQGKNVVIVGVGGAASTHLAQSADEFIFYEQLVGKPLPNAATPASGRRISDIDEFERERAGRNERVAVTPARPQTTKAERKPAVMSDEQAHALLTKAVVEARSRNMLTAFGSIKVLMRELSDGEFREQQVRDSAGRPFERFKDFIYDAARRGVVVVSNDGVVNEVFLPGEDPAKVSQFGASASAPATDDGLEITPPVVEKDPQDAPGANGKSRRRRRNERPEPTLPPVELRNESLAGGNDTSSLALVEAIASVDEMEGLGEMAPSGDQEGAIMVAFSDEERQLVRAIVANSARPMSFQQIYDALRGGRNRGDSQHPPRTNEELRSLVKLAINSGDIQRIGRGNRVSYRMPNQPNATKATDVAEMPEVADASPSSEAPARESAESVVVPSVAMIPTPDDSEDALLPPRVLPSVDRVSDERSVAPPARGRRRASAKTTPEQPAVAVPAPAKARRKEAVPSPVAPVADALTAPSAPEPTAPKTPRRRTPKKPSGEA
jgi:uncharacterized protein (TIGR00288 family)